MKPLTALTSVMTTAAFHASVSGEIIDVNAPFVQLMRSVPGDDWRRNVVDSDRALVDAYWVALFNEPTELHQPVQFSVKGGDRLYELRGQAVSDESGEYHTAVGVLMVEASSGSTSRWVVDQSTGLPEHNAVHEQIDQLNEAGTSFIVAVVLLEGDSNRTEDQKTAARQLLSVIRPNDLLAGQADGRFLLCASGVETNEAALALAERLIDSLASSSIRARVGLAMGDSSVGPATLVREAEAGAYASDIGAFGFAPNEEAA